MANGSDPTLGTGPGTTLHGVSGTAPVARLSATVMLLRETAGRLEVLLQRRAATLWYGGSWVFPGGSVDAADGDVAQDLPGAVRRAAVRECREEAGVDLQAGVDPDGLLHWSRWITPAGRERRFDTWFYAAVLPEGQQVAGDACETVESEWFEPESALEHAASGRMTLMPPTRMSLLDLQLTHARHGTLAGLLRAERARPIVPILPRLVGPAEARVAVYPWDPDYAALPGEGIALAGEAPEHLRRLPSRLVLGGSGEPVRPMPRVTPR
jgi:8-oxo-dGTP pyrophosphatase MutT (NUDIX family)